MFTVAQCRLAVCAVLLLLLAGRARADQPSQTDEEMVQKVWLRIVAVAEPVEGLEWPPACTITNVAAINAFATVDIVPAEKPRDKASKPAAQFKIVPRATVFRGMMEKIIHRKSDKDLDTAADRLAYVLGHEIAHLLLGHLKRDRVERTPLVRRVFGREQEIAADIKGAELALKAGFSFRRGVETIRRMQAMGLDYSSFEGLHADHPSWNDRLALLDREQATLWKAMSAFENGTFFLLTEQFASAEVSFRQVTREFPKCYEAWANLGYALLMQYCDGLDADDLRRFKIGQIWIGGFYRRPKSLEAQTRGIQAKVWEEAVACLQKSLQLQSDQVLPKANLGVAYLVHPDGQPELAKATHYLQQAAERAAKDKALDPVTRASILINAGVADLANRRVEESIAKLDSGEQLGTRLYS